MIIIFGQDVQYIDRGILVDHYHYMYGEEETVFVFKNNKDFNIVETAEYSNSYYFCGIISNINEKYITVNLETTDYYITTGNEIRVLLTNSPEIISATDGKENLKIGQFVEIIATKIENETYPFTVAASEIIIREITNSQAAYGL